MLTVLIQSLLRHRLSLKCLFYKFLISFNLFRCVFYVSFCFPLFIDLINYRASRLVCVRVFNLRFIALSASKNVSLDPVSDPELSRWHSYGHVSFRFLSLFFRHFALYGQASASFDSWTKAFQYIPALGGKCIFSFVVYYFRLGFTSAHFFYDFDLAKLFHFDKLMEVAGHIFMIFSPFQYIKWLLYQLPRLWQLSDVGRLAHTCLGLRNWETHQVVNFPHIKLNKWIE